MKLPKWLDNKSSKDNESSNTLNTEASEVTGIPESADDSVKSSSNVRLETSTSPLGILADKIGYSLGNKINDFFLHNEVLNSDEVAFYNELSLKAEEMLHELSDSEEHSDEGNTEPKAHLFDMRLKVFISRDQMKAYGFLIPAVGAGRKLNLEELKASVEREGVLFGVNEELLAKIFNEEIFFKIFTLAEGKAAQEGSDGQIIDMFSREKQINLAVDDHETIDYKNLNWLQKVNKNDVICKIIPPVPAQTGMNVKGMELTAHEGKAAKVPIGKNTIENEDHTALIAAVDGQLTFSNGSFKVDQLLQIDGDVDGSVGNLDVIGSITVKGNVFEGYSIKATGDILVYGSVMGAQLSAGGNIKVVSGTNGSYKGKLEAGGTVSSKYIENCYVSAVGAVRTDSIINSTVNSSDKVIAVSGLGTIIGSTVNSFKGVEVKVIGNERNLLTKITIGSDPKLTEEMILLKKEVYELTRKVEEYDKNIQYLLRMENQDEAHQQLYNKIKLEYSVLNMNLSKKTNRLKVIEEQLSDEACQIVASQIFPPLTVTIGNVTQQFFTSSRMSRIYKREGEIVLGSK